MYIIYRLFSREEGTNTYTDRDFQFYIDHKKQVNDYLRREEEYRKFYQNSPDYFEYVANRELFHEFVEEKEDFEKYVTEMGGVTPFEEKPEKPNNQVTKKGKYAFALYATDRSYACATRVMIYNILKTSDHLDFDIIIYLPPNPRNILDYIKNFDPKTLNPEWKGEYIIKIPETVQTPSSGLYKYTMLKLMPMNEIEYDRIIYMDADAYGPLKDLTHLFNLPPVGLAAPVGYWENELCFTSLLLVYKPSKFLYNELLNVIEPRKHDTDMNVLNTYFRPKTKGGFYIIHREFLMLPLQYGTLTHSINKKQKNNPDYVGSPSEAFANAYIIHFSEGSKPWSRLDRDRYEGDVFNEWRKIQSNIC